MNEMLGDLAQGMLNAAAANQPRQCSGRIGLNGAFHTTYW
jgi:hypothetical protein